MNRWIRSAITIAIWTLLVGTLPVAAQTPASFEVGVQVPVEHVGELDTTDVGIGVRATWLPGPFIGVEGELNVYPADIPGDEATVSGNRVEGLFGATAGPRFDRWRPFGRLSAGFLRVGEAPEPIVCPAIFPPTIACRLSGGATLFALELGAGAEFAVAERAFVRFDVGDRMVRYPGPVIGRNGESHDGEFFGHDPRLAFSAGWRF
jgi:hypothetical protein